jgi:glycerate 2-kinase
MSVSTDPREVLPSVFASASKALEGATAVRNQHLAAAAAGVLPGARDGRILAAGTDGPAEEAGALVDGDTPERAAVEGFDSEACLRAADAGGLLQASGDLLRTGPTDTYGMDLMSDLTADA